MLQSCGLLTLADLSAFAIYCSLWGRWREAEDALAKQAKLLKTPNGSLQPNPWITISRQSAELLKGYMAEFGMVPASRARMGGAEPPRSGDAAKPPLAGGKFAHLIGAEDKPN